MIEIEVAYATKEKQFLLKVKVLPNSTVEDAISTSGILTQCPEIDLQKNKIGVFSKFVNLTHRLHAGDRVEIYRPLMVDPKQTRALRAKANPLKKKRQQEINEQIPIINAVCQAYDLGQRLSAPTLCSGGLLHRVWRFRTTKNQYVIKILNPTIVNQADNIVRYRITESIAREFAKKIPVVAALTLKDDPLFHFENKVCMVFAFLNAKVLPQKAITLQHIEKISRALARMHQLNISQATAPAVEIFSLNKEIFSKREQQLEKNEKDIAELWLQCIPLVNEIEQKCKAYKTVLQSNLIVSHRDLDPKNVLWDEQNNLTIIDWESAGLINKTKDMLATALYWSFDEEYRVRVDYLQAFLVFYQQFHQIKKHEIEAGLYGFLNDWLGWMEFNFSRLLNTEKGSKEYTLGKVELKKTMRALPVVFNQFSEILDLTRAG